MIQIYVYKEHKRKSFLFYKLIRCGDCITSKLDPVQPEKIYDIVVAQYLANGGDGFKMIKEQKLEHFTGKYQCEIDFLVRTFFLMLWTDRTLSFIRVGIGFLWTDIFLSNSQTCVQQPPLGLRNGRYSKVVVIWSCS